MKRIVCILLSVSLVILMSTAAFADVSSKTTISSEEVTANMASLPSQKLAKANVDVAKLKKMPVGVDVPISETKDGTLFVRYDDAKFAAMAGGMTAQASSSTNSSGTLTYTYRNWLGVTYTAFKVTISCAYTTGYYCGITSSSASYSNVDPNWRLSWDSGYGSFAPGMHMYALNAYYDGQNYYTMPAVAVWWDGSTTRVAYYS